MDVRAEIITVGDEILTGLTVNRNAAVLGERLLEAGVLPRWAAVVSDDEAEIAGAVRRAARRAHVVVVTGGLGPTADDCTRQGVADAAQRKLVQRRDLLEEMQRRWRERGRRMPEINARQAMIPSAAVLVPNRVGTAPGFRLRIRDAEVFVLPGVPVEMLRMLEETVLPELKARCSGGIRRFRTLHTLSWSEARIAAVLSEQLRRSGEWTLAYLPHPGGVDLRIGASGPPARVNRVLSRAEARIRKILGPVVYGVEGETPEGVVGSLLRERGLRLAVAESCTGGLISSLLTDVPGSSDYFDRSVVAYSNRAKVSLLGVAPAIMRAKGAVSGEVAVQMARGVRRISRSDVGLSATGIAGPGGGSETKPVGLVFVGLSAGRRAFAVRWRFPGDRRRVKIRAARAALNLLRLYLLDGTVDEVNPYGGDSSGNRSDLHRGPSAG